MSTLASHQPVRIAAETFATMHAFARAIQRLQRDARYARQLAAQLPPTAAIEPDWPAMLMGYDFHLTDEGPKLIEINNNAGGLYIGRDDAGHDRWLPQPALTGSLEQRLVAMFAPRWRAIAIMDADVRAQFMYPEMCAYARLLRADGRWVELVSPEAISATADGLYVDGIRLDAIYNRHTDFYLQSPELAHVRTAFMAGRIELNPYPRSYALVGDERRMADWWREEWLAACVEPETVALIRRVVPETHRLADMDMDDVWRRRAQFVFKPAARHAGKGVVLGRGMSRKRFATFDPADTIVQQWVPASMVELEGRAWKLDVRLYMHGERLIALAGRVWRGQLTNFREPGSGWVAIDVE